MAGGVVPKKVVAFSIVEDSEIVNIAIKIVIQTFAWDSNHVPDQNLGSACKLWFLLLDQAIAS